MSISRLFVLKRVLQTTQARPSKRGSADFRQEVIGVFYTELSAHYQGLGQVLDEDGFKSNKEVKKLAQVFFDKVHTWWERYKQQLSLIEDNHRDPLEVPFDFSKVDFASLLTPIVQPEPVVEFDDLPETPAKNEVRTTRPTLYFYVLKDTLSLPVATQHFGNKR